MATNPMITDERSLMYTQKGSVRFLRELPGFEDDNAFWGLGA